MKKSTKQILASMAAASVSVLPAFAAAHSISHEAARAPETERVSAGTWSFAQENVLGTSLDASVQAPTRAAAHAAEKAALDEFDRQERILSAWDADSEFSRWERTRGVAVKISPELMDALAAFDAWRGETGGVINASSETAAKLWRSAGARAAAPTVTELHEAVLAMQAPHWTLDRAAGTATRISEAPLVLASFTKSLVTQKAADAALRAGATGVMLNVGGDIVTRGALTQRVDVADPRRDAENDAALDTVVLQDRAIATSGGYRRGFRVAGEQYSHLIDPRTAQPAAGVLSSTVIARDAATAGALATALSVLTPRESQALMERHPEAQYMLVTASGQQIASHGWSTYQQPRVAPAGYRVAAGSGAPVGQAAGAWNQSMELSIKLDVPRIDNPRYRRPYVAVWVEDKDKYPVRTIALWFKNPRWLNELKTWYRDDQVRNLSEGSDISATVSSATRAPGSYTLRWDGKDNAGKLLKAGKYTLVIEAAREHGGHSVVRQEIDFNGKPQQFSLPAGDELGAVQLDYRKH